MAKKNLLRKDSKGGLILFQYYLSLKIGQDLAPFKYDGCQGFTGPDPSAFLDNSNILKNNKK